MLQQQQVEDQNEPISQFKQIPRYQSFKILNPQVYYYHVAPGNNSKLIIQTMKKRKNWQESENNLIHFQWNMSDKNFKYLTLSQSNIQIVNHLQNHRELTMKCNLIRNLKQFCQSNKRYVWDVTPLSFIIDLYSQESNLNRVLQEFTYFYEQFKPSSDKKSQHNCPSKRYQQYIHPKMHYSFYDEEDNYIWILKPNEFNRGRGIQFFRTIEELKQILKDFTKGTSEYQFSQGQIKSSSFVIQKYIQRPLLLDGRKFDIRIWVLVTYSFEIYVFNQGYARLSSEMFDLNQLDAFIHLTNNAVQKHSKNYGFFELGNQISYSELDYYTNGEFTKTVLPKLKSIIVFSWMAVQNTFKKFKYSFEIFGYDFMLDEQLKPWLIEINTNPCLEESSPLLKELIPKMIDDAFKIVIDPLISKVSEPTGWDHLLQL
ncbi:unnamed protein product (macronuclear) [Paramecium tetraurelia]|uniref:Tubulin-tyrosine ligase family protein n=1 Tax=Paramecium tetraurelia TaxID=5888 RepID=A0BJX8_PARTE|nr:uncharacterized protein GSPATT00029475001 [Paramecium tetraurelia]CAK58845.1 unnamed protein product [Paramecium tetraurelia]|eukprot:XP_001426243.1 hypothetical protein (macronuclear) [Paramecium tetraurelia strain d4-2]